MEEIVALFDDGGLMPHGHCYLWRPELVWLHVLSDGLIALAYFSIPVTLAVFVWRRRESAFNAVFLLFAAFIFACGTTHALSAVTLWVPIYGAEGIVKLATGLVSAVTAVFLVRVLPEALSLPGLRLANEKLRVVADALPVLIAYVDRDETYRMANRMHEEWFGIPADDLRGRTLGEVLDRASYERVAPHVRKALGGERVTFEEDISRQGDTRHVEGTCVPDPAGGESPGTYTLLADVSDRKRAEQAEREYEKLRVLAQTAGAAAHEINQPLTAVVGEAELLLNRENLDRETSEGLAAIRDAGRRIEEIVEKMGDPRRYVTKPYLGETRIVDFDGAAEEEGEDRGES